MKIKNTMCSLVLNLEVGLLRFYSWTLSCQFCLDCSVVQDYCHQKSIVCNCTTKTLYVDISQKKNIGIFHCTETALLRLSNDLVMQLIFYFYVSWIFLQPLTPLIILLAPLKKVFGIATQLCNCLHCVL